jgi:hypothetical protein
MAGLFLSVAQQKPDAKMRNKSRIWDWKIKDGHNKNRITLIGDAARFVKRLTVNVTVTSRVTVTDRRSILHRNLRDLLNF